MENAESFKKAMQLLLLAKKNLDRKPMKNSVFGRLFGGGSDALERKTFSKYATMIIENLMEADKHGAVCYEDNCVPWWSTSFFGKDGNAHHISMSYMLCVGNNTAMIRLFHSTLDGSSYQPKEKVAYMVIVIEGSPKIKKYTGWKVSETDATPDWEA